MYKKIVSICLITFFFISLALPVFAVDVDDSRLDRSISFSFYSTLREKYNISYFLNRDGTFIDSSYPKKYAAIDPADVYYFYYQRDRIPGFTIFFYDSSHNQLGFLRSNYTTAPDVVGDISVSISGFTNDETGDIYTQGFYFSVNNVNAVFLSITFQTTVRADFTASFYQIDTSNAVVSDRNPSVSTTEYQYGSTDPILADDGKFYYASVPASAMIGSRLRYYLNYGVISPTINPVPYYRNFYIYLPASTPIDDIVISDDLLPYYKGYSRVIYSSTSNTVLNLLSYSKSGDYVSVTSSSVNYNTYFSSTNDSYPIVMYALQFNAVPSGLHVYTIDFPFPTAPTTPDYLYVIPCFESSSLVDPNQFNLQDYIDGLQEILDSYNSGDMDYYIARVKLSRLYREFLDKAVTVNQRQEVENYNISYRNQLDEAAGIDTSKPPSEYYYSQFGDLIDGLYVDFTPYSFSYDIDTPIEYNNDVVSSAFSSLFGNELIITMLVLVASFATIGYILYGKKA